MDTAWGQRWICLTARNTLLKTALSSISFIIIHEMYCNVSHVFCVQRRRQYCVVLRRISSLGRLLQYPLPPSRWQTPPFSTPLPSPPDGRHRLLHYPRPAARGAHLTPTRDPQVWPPRAPAPRHRAPQPPPQRGAYVCHRQPSLRDQGWLLTELGDVNDLYWDTKYATKMACALLMLFLPI